MRRYLVSGRGVTLGRVVLATGVLALAAQLAGPTGAEPTKGVPGPRTAEEARIELGRRLFFDPVASRSGARACASCHDPEHGFSDPAKRSDDDIARTARHSQTLIDGHLNPTAHWDGEFNSIEELVTARLGPVQGTRGSHVSRGAHGPLGEIGDVTGGEGLTAEPAKSRSGGGYGGPPTTPPPSPPSPPNQPRDPQPPPSDPDPVTPDDPEAPKGDDKDKDHRSKDKASKDKGDKDKDGKDKDGKDKSARNGETVHDRSTRQGLDQVRTLPLDLTRLPDVARTIEDSGRYDEAFQAAFGSRSVTTSRLAEAIASYCRSIQSQEAPVDRYLRGENEALSASARRGLELFRGRANCVQCHAMRGEHPVFSDYDFHNTGVSWRTKNLNATSAKEEIDLDRLLGADKGRETISRSTGDRRAFKTATLRDLTRRGPYMHDGSLATLADVVRYYAAGGSNDEKQDKRLRGFTVSDEEVADLVAFLESLTGDQAPGRAPRAWHARAERQRVRLVDGRGKPLAGMPVTLTPEGDALPVAGRERAAAVEAFADLDGWLELAPSCRTHMRVGLAEGLPLEGGGLIPDTCKEATLVVPVDGRVTLVVSFESGAPAPEVLVAEHELTMRLPGHPAPRTIFKRVAVLNLAGREVGSYEGWRRTDLPPEVIVRFPGDSRPRPEHRLKLTDERTLKLDLE